MNILLSILLIALGLLLWLGAGLLPVVRLGRVDGTVTLAMQTTWMGALTLSRREVTGVRDARFVQDPNSRRGGEVQVKRNGGWEPLSVGLLPEATLLAQLVDVIGRLSRQGDARRDPTVLTLPMRGRLNLMLGFAVFFPLGTVSIFAGVLLLTIAL